MKSKILGFLAIIVLISSCDNEDTPTFNNLTLNLTGLGDLGSNAQYEGWLIVDGAPVSTGVFSVDANGQLSETSFEVDAQTAASATKFVLTVEPNPDPDPAPSAQKLLAGDFVNGTASVDTGTAPALGSFANASGTMFLRTPTDETNGNNGNDQYGVWFGTLGAPPTSGLNLPVLSDGWVYEGWVIGDAGPLTTGRFTSFNEADQSNFFSGTENNAGPPIPGEDFFNNAPSGETFPLDLRGRTIVISVEPEPDNSPAPFLLKPLFGQVPANAETAPAVHELSFYSVGIPSGSVSIN